MSSMREAFRAKGITPTDFSDKQDTMKSLEEYYYEKYGKPTNDLEAQKLLANIYNELLGGLNPEIQEGIAEYYRIIQSRGLPAFHWIVEAFHVVSKKDKSKRNFAYVVGMLRHWLKYGFGHIPSQEEEDIVRFFEEAVGCEVSLEARQMIQTLLGQFGAVKCAVAIPELKEVDRSLVMAKELRTILIKKFGEQAV